jgi:hypothetical protein
MRMSKKIRFALATLIASIALFVGLSQPSSGSSHTDSVSVQPRCSLCLGGEQANQSASWAQQNPATIRASRSAALSAATRDVLKETSEIRQLSILRPVQSSAQSRAEIERMIMKNLDQEMTPARTHAAEVTLKKLGMVSPDFQYRALLIRLLTEQVAGYYDPRTREFHLADWIDIDGQRPIMAHELTHALQDQHFNLRRFEHWPKGDSDAELAAHALIEGDATLTMALYIVSNPLSAPAFLKSLGTASMSSVELDKAPRAVRESLLFPYQQGLDWTTNLYKRGGWDGVSRAFTELPQSTEQILHPEKYFAHEAPVKVTLPDITLLLNRRGQRLEVGVQRSEISGQWAVGGEQSAAGNAGILPAFSGTDFQSVIPIAGLRTVSGYAFTGSADAPPAFARYSSLITQYLSLSSPAPDTRSPAPASWRRLDYDVQGEWGFYLILDQFLKSPAESRRAAAGWGGDSFAVYEGPKGEVPIASLSTWDTENDAREFFDAYVKRTELRYPSSERLESPSSEDQTRNSKLETRNFQSWRTSEGAVIAELRGSRVLIVEGIPDRVDPNALLRSLRQ